jgi:phospholipid/cholesterol/gamma-HCH transport system ATP-binding protein
MEDAALQYDHVSASFVEGLHVDDLCCVVRRHELVALVGGNGSGKNLALKLGAGLESPDAGTVRVLGQDPLPASERQFISFRRRLGVVFERPALISNLTVFNNIVLPLRYHTDLIDSEIDDRVMAALRQWGIEAFHDRFPAELTLGDSRLAAMARATILNPEILFIDEILFGLDAGGLGRVQALIEQARAQRQMTIVAAVNAPTRLFALMDRLLFFHDGRLVADSTPAEAGNIKEPMLQEFLH